MFLLDFMNEKVIYEKFALSRTCELLLKLEPVD